MSQRILRNIRDSRMVKLIDYMTRFSLTAQIKINGKPLSSILTFIILVFGLALSVKLAFRYVVRPIFYPLLRKVFYKIIVGRSNLLPPVNNLSQQVNNSTFKFALIYGATNHLGTQAAKVFA